MDLLPARVVILRRILKQPMVILSVFQNMPNERGKICSKICVVYFDQRMHTCVCVCRSKTTKFLTKKLPELALVTGGMTFGTQISPLLNVYVY